MRLIDVRPIAKRQRHPKIFAAFDALAEGDVLHIVSDHEPRPLRYEFESSRSGLFAWSQRCLEEHHWEAFIRRVSTTPAPFDPVAILRNTGASAALDDAAIARLAGSAKTGSLSRARAIIEQGSKWPYLGIVVTGMVQACAVTPSGREVALRDYLPHEFFGELSFFDDAASPARYAARTDDTVVMLLSRAAVLGECDRNPAVARALASVVSHSSRALVERISTLASQPIVARLACALLPYAAPVEGLHPPLGPLAQVRQAEFAAAAGTSKDLVYRGLTELEAGGALVRERGQVTGLDRARLEEFARITKY
jgi:uncharacterized protein (DUF2249 family)